MKNILIIEDDVVFSRSISNWLKKKGMATAHVATLSAARKELQAKEFDLVLADLRLPDGSSMELLRWMKGKHYSIPFLIMTSYGQVENAVEAMQLGASNYLCKPVQPDRLWEVIEKEFSRPQHGSTEFYRGESEKSREMYRLIGPVARSDMSVLLRGASGTGKEHIAAEIHERSLRRHKPFVAVDCGAVSDDLVRSEFFGYCKGAFTGADSDKAGLFQAAEGGTLFLDEIGNLSLPMQSKLLTAIEKRQISRLGSTQTMPIDVRLICATNADIRHMVDEGSFRQDLLYRINTIEIHIPPLRERGNDIILLAEYFLDRYARKYKKEMRGLTREAKNKLLKYTWPGNVRELQHTMERVVILGDGSLLKPENFQFHVTPKQKKEEEIVLNLEQLERQTIEKAMKLSEGNISRAADYLGITRFALYRKLEKLGL